MVINIHAQNIALTEALKQYTEEKVRSLEKYFDAMVQVDVTIGMLSRHHQKGKIFFSEMILYVPNNKIVVKKESEDQYKAIDKVRDHLKVELEKLKGKMRAKDRSDIREQREYQQE